jgi:hypothetical protein
MKLRLTEPATDDLLEIWQYVAPVMSAATTATSLTCYIFRFLRRPLTEIQYMRIRGRKQTHSWC